MQSIPKIVLITLLAALLSVATVPVVSAQDELPAKIEEILAQVEGDVRLQVAGEHLFMPGELQRFYGERDYLPLWSTDDPRGREQIRVLLHYLSWSTSEGLCEVDYHLPFFRTLLSRFTIAENDYRFPYLRWSGWYDLLLTDALFHYAMHLLEGRVPSEAIQDGWTLRKQKVDLSRVVAYTFDRDELEKVLHDIQPSHPGYLKLQKALSRYREIEAFGGWARIPDGETLRPGMFDRRISLLRTRLLLTDDLETLPPLDSLRMESEDVEAVKHFQRRHGLYPDGVVGERTLAALNVPVSQRVRQIELNMERWRWLPKSLGRNYLLVNIADFRANVVEEEETVLSLPVVVGNAYRKTPVFSAELEYVEFAPYWLVPPTILEEDKLPVIRSDPGYLQRNHYEIVSWDQQQDIDPQSIDWSTVDGESFPGVLRQRPGPWNPLGRVKFIFPNDYAIYLHDTNRRDLFRQRNRKYSSGCIRLQRPDKLANYLLCDSGWNEKLVDKAMSGSVSQQVYLEQPLPVHVLYWTSWIDDDGLVNFREDVYNRDQDLQQALDQLDAGCIIHKPNLARR